MSALTIQDDRVLTSLPEALQDGFDQLLRALCLQRRSTLVTCSDTQELDRVSRVLTRLLRQVPGLALEVLQPTGSESLIRRFNERVEALPLDRARRDDPDGEPLTLWVVHLRRHLEWSEVNLLLSLVQGFPGTGVRLLLLCGRDAASDQAAQLGARWGSHLHHWNVSPGNRSMSDGAAAAAVAAVTAVASRASGPALPQTPSRMTVIGAVTRRVWSRCLPALRALARGAARASKSLLRISGMAPVVAALVVRIRLTPPRWRWGLGGLMMSLGATSAAWWQAKPDAGPAQLNPLRRPVPEIVELLEDARTPAVRQENRS
ncbi:MAG: hypothetical protein EBS47_07650 [Betaproteobacteria bacterium]|nr:hypothetical protein [Betaproteobacteria bacterium]NBU49963.1 hypothetical protein [Betaproteobacteria bacterium]